MCDAVKEYGNEREEIGKEIGEAKALIQTVNNIIKNINCSLNEALKIAGVTKEQFDKYSKISDENN